MLYSLFQLCSLFGFAFSQQFHRCIFVERPADKISLYLITSVSKQILSLTLLFHALRDRAMSQFVRHGNNIAGDGFFGLDFQEVIDKILIDFQAVDMEQIGRAHV